MSTLETFDVVIAGAGPTGLTLANLLGLYGVRTLLLEQNKATVGEPRAVSIDDESLRSLQMVGLAEIALAQMSPGYGSVYLDPKRRPFAAVHPVIEEYGWTKRNAFRQPVLEATLAEGAAARPSVDMRFEAVVSDHVDDGAGVTIKVSQPGRDYEVRAAYLVGCDGGRSRTRRAIGATLGGSSFEEKWLILDTVGTTDPTRETHVFSDPYRPALSLPGPNRTRRYEIRLRPGEDAAEMETEAKARELIAWYGGDPSVEIERRVVYNFQARVADIWRRGRVFLCGDAAHLTPPFAGQGMNAGLRDVSNLAWKLHAVLSGRIGEGLLDTYQIERRDHAWGMIEYAITMGIVISPHHRLRAWATRLLFRAMGLVPTWKDWLVQMKFKPKPRFDAGFLIPGGKLPGTMFPQPRIEVAAGDIRRLDSLLGSGFSALVCAADPGALWNQVGPHVPSLFQDAVVGIRPELIAFGPTPFAHPMLRDVTGGTFRAIAPLTQAVVLLRPDRYVAAVLTPENAASLGPLLAKMLDATFAGIAPVMQKAA